MNRRVALAAVAVVTVLCIVGASVLAVAAGGQSLAYSVNGTRVSQSTVDNQLDDLASSEATKQASQTPGSVDSAAAAQVLTLNIARDLMRDAAEKRGVKVTDADRTAASDQIGDQIQGYPESYVDLIIDLRAHASALGLASDDEINTFLAQQFRRADIEVNPRYGRWVPRFGVCPPTGCAAATAGSGATAGG